MFINNCNLALTRRNWMLAALAPRPRSAIAVFQADVTPPVGSPLFTRPATRIADPLTARGFVLHGAGSPIVVLALDWCETRNDSFDLWRTRIAAAAGSTPDRVLLSCVHQHDAPYTDSGAQRFLDAAGLPLSLCDPAFERSAIDAVAAAIAKSNPREVTHIGTGKARVDDVASNRRYVTSDGQVSFGRTSATRDPAIRAMPEGLVDPWLRTLTFYEGAHALTSLAVYSTHPMSYYGQGEVTCDFPGLARNRLQAERSDTFLIYGSGASGDTMAGKYNDGAPANRSVLAGRMYDAIRAALDATERVPIGRIRFRNAELRMKPRHDPPFAIDAMRAKIAEANAPLRERLNAALGLSWRERLTKGRPIDVPAVNFGSAQLLLLPAEAFVQYQLWAQERGPFVVTLGYGECAPGYIPTRKDVADGYDDHYSWVDLAAAEPAMRGAIRRALG
ncbi:MAG: hypothetical protein R2729_06240 [Bryobacteraceae bacterium]